MNNDRDDASQNIGRCIDAALIAAGATLAPISNDPAVQLIASMAADGHTARVIADALTRAGLPTNRGKARWPHKSVDNLAKANGIKIAYDPGKIRAAQLRDRQRAGS